MLYHSIQYLFIRPYAIIISICIVTQYVHDSILDIPGEVLWTELLHGF